jgi:hypothetical protein
LTIAPSFVAGEVASGVDGPLAVHAGRSTPPYTLEKTRESAYFQEVPLRFACNGSVHFHVNRPQMLQFFLSLAI